MWVKKFLKLIRFFVSLFFLLGVLYCSIKIIVVDQFVIQSSSMEPTLHIGERIWVDKTILGGRVYKNYMFKRGGQPLECFRLKGRRALRHNDIVVFNCTRPGDGISFGNNNEWCMRILALPGDTLYVENGIYRNNNYDGELGVIAEQKKLQSTPDSVLCAMGKFVTTVFIDSAWTQKNMGPYYIPRSGDMIKFMQNDVILYHDIVLLETGKNLIWNKTKNYAMLGDKPCEKYEFKDNYYFVGSDNFKWSCDSRYFGLVPEDYIVGVVRFVFFSRNPKTNKIRWNRIFQHI